MLHELIIISASLLVGFIGGYAFYRKNGKRVEADLAATQAHAWNIQAELEALKAKLKD